MYTLVLENEKPQRFETALEARRWLNGLPGVRVSLTGPVAILSDRAAVLNYLNEELRKDMAKAVSKYVSVLEAVEATREELARATAYLDTCQEEIRRLAVFMSGNTFVFPEAVVLLNFDTVAIRRVD